VLVAETWLSLAMTSMTAGGGGTFSEQIGVVVDWFNGWSDCEKVVALYCLLRKLPPPQSKFLSQVLDQIIANCSPIDLEEQANDPGQLASYVYVVSHLPSK